MQDALNEVPLETIGAPPWFTAAHVRAGRGPLWIGPVGVGTGVGLGVATGRGVGRGVAAVVGCTVGMAKGGGAEPEGVR